MAVLDRLNTAIKSANVQVSLVSDSKDMRNEFQRWLIDGNARKYSPEIILSCMDKISEYAVRKKIATGGLWEYRSHSTFNPIYHRLIETKLLRVTDKSTHKVFIVAGQLYLRFLKGKPFVHNKAIVDATEADKAESVIEPVQTTIHEIDPENVIAWLVRQPNANGTLYLENVVRQYMGTLRTAPAKLDIPITKDFRSVFACRTPDDLAAYWESFKAAPNYKQVNSSTSGMFSAALKCYMRYLQHLAAINQVDRQEVEPTQLHETYLITKDMTVDDVLITRILSQRFSNGYRLNSPIEMARFRSFMAEDFEEQLTLSDEELTAYIAACGTNYEGKIYVVSAKAKERIKELVEDYFADGAQVIFFAEFYVKNENWLFGASVVSEDMMIGILRRLFPDLSFTQTYFGYTNSSVSTVLENEILRVWSEDVLLTYEQLSTKLQYIPLDRIKSALAQNGDFIWNSVETYSHVSRIEVDDEDRQNIYNTAVQECNTHGYVSITDLPFGEIEMRNYELSVTAIHNAVYRICLSDKFDKKGKIITRKGDVFDALTIMKEFCRTIDKCSLDDLLNYEKELTGEIHRWIPMEAANNVLVRVDKDCYVANKYVYFNSDLIDESIELVVKGDYLPLKSFTTFGVFPDCGQTWNLFLLESYCRRFSRKFRFDAPSVNSRNAGAIIRKTCAMNYTEIMTDAVANADISLNSTAVGHFLFDSGYTGRSTNAKVTEIIDKAKIIREKRE